MTATTIHGTTARNNRPPACTGKEMYKFNGKFNGNPATIGFTASQVDKHTLLIGGTGCGKTTLMDKFIEQTFARLTADDVMIIFDSKGDFYRKFGTRPNTSVIGNSDEYRARSQKWNIFSELYCGAQTWQDVETHASEICKILFADRIKHTNNPFFPTAANMLFAAILIFLCRAGQEDSTFKNDKLNNRDLKALLEKSQTEDLLDFLSYEPDMAGVASFIEGGGEQACGVMAEMHSVVRDVLTGVFAEFGRFSIKDFVRNRGGKVLFIEYDLSIGQSLTPIYRLLIDLALKEAMGRSRRPNGSVYLFCDEFRLVPHLQHMDDGVNFGRSYGVKVFAGMQSVEQVYDLYGESHGRALLAGFSNLIAFNTFDPSTMKYVRERSGRNVISEATQDITGQYKSKFRESYCIEDHDLYSLAVGEAIVSPAFGQPFKFYFAP